jgi:anti-sigma regulatory factor (Ser/Thr protein kinase)
MADGPYPDETTGNNGRVHQGWPGPAHADGQPPLLDLSFDAETLHTARSRIRAYATRARIADDRVEDMVLAVHELAANTIRHGGGAGRLRIWELAGALYCQVDDGDATAAFVVDSLPCEPGHGLWVARQVADQLRTLSGPGGTCVLVRFDLAPGQAASDSG